MAQEGTDNQQIDVEEISIKVPWGHLACKWWGPKNVRPIVALHGWQHNAGTYDRLIPLLPRNISYLAVDLPGHGLSSWIPDGFYYTTAHYVYVLMYLVDHFKWNKVSLMGHSLGGIVSFFYATKFLDGCDFVIALDAISPFMWEPNKYIRKRELQFKENYKLDLRNQAKSLPPTYSYEKALDMFCCHKGDHYLSQESAKCLLVRGLKRSVSDDKQFHFTRDSRIRYQVSAVSSVDRGIASAHRINIPFCYIRVPRIKIDRNNDNKEAVITAMKQNKQFELHTVSGNHFVHLNEPKNIAGIITVFINKYHYLRTCFCHL